MGSILSGLASLRGSRVCLHPSRAGEVAEVVIFSVTPSVASRSRDRSKHRRRLERILSQEAFAVAGRPGSCSKSGRPPVIPELACSRRSPPLLLSLSGQPLYESDLALVQVDRPPPGGGCQAASWMRLPRYALVAALSSARTLAVVATAVLLLLVATVAPSAGAHSRSTFWWSRGDAENALLRDGFRWSDGTYSDVFRVACFGRGTSKRGRYKHFDCFFDVVGSYRKYDILHTTGQHTFVLTKG